MARPASVNRVRSRSRARGSDLDSRLAAENLPGLADPAERSRFIRHLERAAHRTNALRRIARDPGAADVCTLKDDRWSPLPAIVQWARAGQLDEATWLAYLTTFFGPDERKGRETWYATRVLYGGLGEGHVSWRAVSADPESLAALCRRHADLYATLPRGNHRKNEPRFDVEHPRGILGSVPSLTALAERCGGLATWFADGDEAATARFARLMEELRPLVSFGRTGRFDLLILLGDLGVYELDAPRLYLEGATGPKIGARRVLPGTRTLRELDDELTTTAARIGVEVQAMEDALCNWQKH